MKGRNPKIGLRPFLLCKTVGYWVLTAFISGLLLGAYPGSPRYGRENGLEKLLKKQHQDSTEGRILLRKTASKIIVTRSRMAKKRV